jgi:PPE-repeat protein
MDFGIYPPEVNSGRMYTGPGSGPMLAAALAWEGLADELYTAAGSYQSVVSGLIAGPWSGPSSVSMATAAASYVTWLSATAAQAEETAAQANAAVAAYEAAFASTVPPPVIAANRTLLMTLVATNFFGQNTPAIAATEAQYAEMWAQDAAAMYGYAGSSASATALTPFSPPRPNTDPGGWAGQAAAVGQATSTSAGNVQSIVSTVPQAFSVATAAPAAATDPPAPLTTLSDLITIFLTGPGNLATLFGVLPMDVLSGPVSLAVDAVGTVAGLHTDEAVSGWAGVETWPGTASVPPTDFPARITNISPTAWAAPTISAGLGQANTVGALSVPPTWTVTAPAIRPVALASPAASATAASVSAAAAETVEVGSGSAFSQMGLAGMVGSAMAGNPGTGGGPDGGKAAAGKRAAARAAGAASTGDRAATDGEGQASQDNPRIVVTGVAARIRQLAKLRDEGRLTEEEFTEQKNRLLGR